MHYLSRWITPPNNTRRYDTRFFICHAPTDQTPSHENYEAIQTRWIRPIDALNAYRNNKMLLIFPTLVTLQSMAAKGKSEGFTNSDELIHNVLQHFNPDNTSYAGGQ